MVGPDDLTNAVGLNSATFNTARIIGPALAGLMIGALGGGAGATGWVILINAAVVRRGDLAARSTWTPRCSTRPKPVARTPGMLLEGVRYVRSQPKMMMILVMVFFAGTFGMNFQITSALMATQVFGKGAGEFGILGSAMAVGSLAGALLAARRVRIRLRLLVAGAAVGFGVAEIVAGPDADVRRVRADRARSSAVCTLTMLNSANATMQLESAPGAARPGDGALHDHRHGRHPDRLADHRLGRASTSVPGGRCSAAGCSRSWGSSWRWRCSRVPPGTRRTPSPTAVDAQAALASTACTSSRLYLVLARTGHRE